MSSFGPYSPIYKTGNIFFVSGQVGVNPENGRSAPNLKEQTKQALENMKSLLKSERLSMSNIAKTTVYLTDMGEFVEMNEVYESFFDTPRPARSTVAVKELPRVGTNTLKVEKEATAFAGSSNE